MLKRHGNNVQIVSISGCNISFLGWVYTAIIMCMFPISIMTILACTTLVVTMFFINEDVKKQTNLPEHDSTNFSSPTANSAIETVDETMEIKNPYNDEVVKIPIWRGQWKKSAIDGHENNSWNHIPSTTQTHFYGKESLQKRKNGDAFGVELKLFHYGGRKLQILSEEERATAIVQKKNIMKEKCRLAIKKAHKKNRSQRNVADFVSKLTGGPSTSKVNKVQTTEIISEHNDLTANENKTLNDNDVIEVDDPTNLSNGTILNEHTSVENTEHHDESRTTCDALEQYSENVIMNDRTNGNDVEKSLKIPETV